MRVSATTRATLPSLIAITHFLHTMRGQQCNMLHSQIRTP